MRERLVNQLNDIQTRVQALLEEREEIQRRLPENAHHGPGDIPDLQDGAEAARQVDAERLIAIQAEIRETMQNLEPLGLGRLVPPAMARQQGEGLAAPGARQQPGGRAAQGAAAPAEGAPAQQEQEAEPFVDTRSRLPSQNVDENHPGEGDDGFETATEEDNSTD